MKNSFRLLSSAVAFASLMALSSTGFAQNRIGGAVQQGKGAYVQKTSQPDCITNSLLGISALGADCLQMQQTKFVVTPSGNAMSVWTGTVAAASRPAKRTVFNSTWTETLNDGVTRTYDTEAVTDPSGAVKLTLTDKANGKANGKGKGK
ncbi:hypothetical protein [Hymenobacter sp. BT190]|uniref:hypothetical protein n=1 Tax=Hymenobacter sp. BT190 TaxID=2763505 RepID=UPI0016510E9E|nr:hypothetical protein [Hymenobacter sp. BT190]MBC6696838.1 hypothetical protein [Hymenobacter sp. BT190]